MRYFLIAIATLALFSSCAQSQTKAKANAVPTGSARPQAHEAVATFGEGCFWHSEVIFQSLAGVRDAVSGYAGGSDLSPDYEKVSSATTGHAECVQVYYDPSKISYETLVKAFFASHDPTSLNRQGPDEGTQYRSIAFYRNEKEKQIIEGELKRIAASKKYLGKPVTEVVPFTRFFPAEAYHQEYVSRHPDNPYVQRVSIRDYKAFRKEFKGPFKPGIL